MPLPVIPVVVISVGAIGAGVAAGARGVQQIVTARREQASITESHREAYEELELIRVRVDQTATDYGHRQFQAQEETIGRFAAWLEDHQKLVRRLDGEIVDGVELNVPQLQTLRFDLEHVKSGSLGILGAGGAAVSAQVAALWGVGSLASAGTGTAISQLSGIAAQNATLAWLGGGTLSAGGAGIAGGTIVLGFIAAAPAAIVAGATLAWSGARERERVAKHVADAEVQIESMKAAGDLTKRIGDRVNELRDVMSAVRTRADDALVELEQLDFDPEAHGPQLLRVVQLIRALREILNVPIIDEEGNLTHESIQVIARYR